MWIFCLLSLNRKRKMCRWTLPSYYPRAFIDHLRSTWNKQMKQGEGWHVHSKRTIYTLKPFNIAHQPTWKMINNTWRKNLKKHFFKHVRVRIHPHVQNTLSLQYTSGKPQKKDNQNHVCILLHREALSVIRCVLLQAYSYWYLLQSREKKVNFVFKWQSFHVHF